MKISEFKDAVLEKNLLFEVASVRPGVKFGRQTKDSCIATDGSIEAYLTKIAEHNNLNTLHVQTYSRNGTSAIPRGFFQVEIKPTVDTPTPRPEIPTPRPEPAKTNAYMDKNDLRAEIENAKLTTEVAFLKRENEELRRINKNLEQRNDLLFAENNKLNTAYNNEKERVDLEYRKKEIEMMAGQSKGLNGIIESASKLPPESWALANKALDGLLMKINPNYKPAAALEGANTPTHENPDAQTIITALQEQLVSQRPEVVGIIGALAGYYIIEPEAAGQAYQEMIKKQQQKNAASQ